MSHTIPQKVKPTASSKLSGQLCISFTQIRRILPSNTFAVLAVCYARHQINQKNSDMLRHDSMQITEQAREILLPLSNLWLVYLLYKLSNRPNGLPPSGTFMVCSIAKYRIDQTDFYPLRLDGSTICNQLGLSDDQGLRWCLIYTPHWIYRYHSNSNFKAIWRRGPVSMMIMRLRRIVWCRCNGIDRKMIHRGNKEGWGMKLTSYV